MQQIKKYLGNRPVARDSQNKAETISPESKRRALVMARMWEKLISFGLIHEPIGSPMFDDWAKALATKSEASLAQGINLAAKYTGYLKMGDFMQMCEKPARAPYHSEFKALPHKAMDKEVFKAKLKKMREELGI